MQEKTILSYYLIVLLKRIKLVILFFFVVSILSFVYAFFIKEKIYRAQLAFLPPIRESRMASVIPGLNLDLFSGASVAPEQIVEVFNSKALRRQVIDKYDLINKYKLQDNPNKYENALKKLGRSLTMEVGEVGSIGFSNVISFKISSLHTSPDTCYDIAKYTFFLLDSTVKNLSIDLARRERIYIEIQLEKTEEKYDTLQKNYHNFQINNKAFDIPEQIYYALKNYALIRSQILTNNIKLTALKTDFQSNFYEIKRIREMNKVLNSELKHLEKTTEPDIFPGLEVSPQLFAEYKKFLVDLETQNQLIVFLKKELEQSKLKEARNVSSLHIIDPPFVPEYKFKPKRIFVMAGIIIPVMLILIFLILFQEYYHLNIKDNETYSRMIDAFKRGLYKKG